MLATACKDKVIRCWDPRKQRVLWETQGHKGTKGSRVCFSGSLNLLVSTGFGKDQQREVTTVHTYQLLQKFLNVIAFVSGFCGLWDFIFIHGYHATSSKYLKMHISMAIAILAIHNPWLPNQSMEGCKYD